MIHVTDYYGRVLCNKSCPARFLDKQGYPQCNANLRAYPSKWDGVKKIYVPLCKIPKEYSLIKNE